MRTTPRVYYNLFVAPNLYDYLDAPSINRAYNASATASFLADVMYAFYKRNDTSKISRWPSKRAFLDDLRRREKSFVIIRSIATVYRHLYTEDTQYELPSPGPERIVVPALNAEIEELDGGQRYDIIFRRRSDGTEVSLTEALNAVINKMWPAVLPPEDDNGATW
jgi:hypothetical protein